MVGRRAATVLEQKPFASSYYEPEGALSLSAGFSTWALLTFGGGEIFAWSGAFPVHCGTSVASHSIVTTKTVSRYFKIPLGGMCAKSPPH